MPARDEVIAGLRARMEAISRGEGDLGAPEGRAEGAVCAPRPADQARRARRWEGRGADQEPASDDSELTPERAYQKILRLAATREQSSARVRERLARDGYAPEVAEEALARAVRASAVDDRRYAESLVRMRIAAGKGVEGVVGEIEELGIDPWSLEAYAEYREQGEDADVDRALSLLERRPPRAKNQRDAAFRKLVQQGFSTSTAATAARRWAEGR